MKNHVATPRERSVRLVGVVEKPLRWRLRTHTLEGSGVFVKLFLVPGLGVLVPPTLFIQQVLKGSNASQNESENADVEVEVHGHCHRIDLSRCSEMGESVR